MQNTLFHILATAVTFFAIENFQQSLAYFLLPQDYLQYFAPATIKEKLKVLTNIFLHTLPTSVGKKEDGSFYRYLFVSAKEQSLPTNKSLHLTRS